MESRILKVYSNGSMELEIPVEAPNLPRGWVKPDWETRRFNYQVRKNVNDPAIFPTSATPEYWPGTDFAKIPTRWLNFWKDLLAMQKYGAVLAGLTKEQRNFILSAFQDITSGDKAFNNGHEATGPDPRQESLICAGNWVYILDRRMAKVRQKGWGTIPMVKLYSFLTGDIPPVVTKATLSDPRVQVATVAFRNYLGHFTQLSEKKNGKVVKVVPVLFPFLTNTYHWYPEEELKLEA